MSDYSQPLWTRANGLSSTLVELKIITSKLWDGVVDLQSRPELDLENVNNVALVEQKKGFSINLLQENRKKFFFCYLSIYLFYWTEMQNLHRLGNQSGFSFSSWSSLDKKIRFLRKCSMLR